MTDPDRTTARTTEQVRTWLAPGSELDWNGRAYRLEAVGPVVCELASGRIRINVSTVDVVAALISYSPTTIHDPTVDVATRDPNGWERASPRQQAHAVNLSYRLNQIQTGYRLGVPETGAPDERWEPFWELPYMTQRSEQMAIEISDDPTSARTLGMPKISGRQLRRLAKQYAAADFDPAELLDRRLTAHQDPSCGLGDEQRSVVESQLLEQRSASDISRRALLARIRIAFAQRQVETPSDADLRRYVSQSVKRHELEKNAKYRGNIAARPAESTQQIVTTHAGQYVEVDEWSIDMVGSVLGYVLHDLHLLVAIDVHTRAVLAIEVVVGSANAESVLSFLFRTITPVSHRLGAYPVPDDVHLPVPDHLVADLTGLLAAKWHVLPTPLIDTIVTDQGSPFRGRHLEAVLERLMISVLPMPPGRPTGKPHIESLFNRIRQFVSMLPGYTGGSPDKRGDVESVEQGSLAPHQIQDMFVRFAMAYNRAEHQGLAVMPGTKRHMTPLEALAQSNAQRGALETLNPQVVPYWFLPSVSKNVRSQPFQHRHYLFDSPALDDLRGTKQWFHYARLDPTRLWMFHPGTRRWVMLRGRVVLDAVPRSQSIGEAAVQAALENTEWHSIDDNHDLVDALASAYALTPLLNPAVARKRINHVWHRRHEQQLLDLAPAALGPDEPTLPGDDWNQFVTDDSSDWTIT